MARGAPDRMVAKPATIALYVHDLAYTGVVRNTLAIAEALAEDGHRVQIVTALPGGDVPAGVDHVALFARPMRRRKLEQLSVIPALRRYLRRERPSIAISTGNHSHAVVWTSALGLSGTKRVYRISNDLRRSMTGAPSGGLVKRWLRAHFTRQLVRGAHRLVLVSPSLLDDPTLAAAPKGQATVIANGVDIAAARRRALEPSPHPWLDGDVPVVLAIGRLAPQKNFPNLLRAIALLNQDRPVGLIILGESRDAARAELLAQAKALGIGEQLLMPGTTDNVFAWLARADAFALPSWWEGSPNVLLEAMAVRTPVVASRTAGNAAELVRDDAGYLVDPADPVDIAAALERQLDSETRRIPGDRIDEFDLASTLSAWCLFIRKLGASKLDRRAQQSPTRLPEVSDS
jgi:glycosyltransferase involved in cell wall biosynthesis